MRKKFLFILLGAAVSAVAMHHVNKSPLCPAIWYQPDSVLTMPSLIDTISIPETYTMMMVYKSLQLESMQPLWTLSFYDSTSYIMTSDKRTNNPMIYTMYQTLNCDTTVLDRCNLHIGANEDSVSHIQLYEAAYFPVSLTRPQALMFQTYLALRHGITLSSSNYLSSQGKIIWDARKYKEFYNHIQGLGSDPFYNFYTKNSFSVEDSLVMLKTLDTLSVYSYALIGDNGAPVDWSPYEGNRAMLQRRWKLHTTGDIHDISLLVRMDMLPDLSDTLWLATLSEDNRIVSYESPVFVDSTGVAQYTLPTTDTYFSFISRFEHSPSKSHSRERSSDNDGLAQECIVLAPNPTYGDFSIDISLVSEQALTISVFDPAGKLIQRQSVPPVSIYHYDGYIDTQGVYMVIVSGNQQAVLSVHQLVVY